MEAVEVTRRIGAKELSPVEVVDAVLDRMEGLEPILHALRAAEEAERIKAECNGLAPPVPEGQAARVGRWPGSTPRLRAYTVREEEVTKLVVLACPPDRFPETSISPSTPSRTTSDTPSRRLA